MRAIIGGLWLIWGPRSGGVATIDSNDMWFLMVSTTRIDRVRQYSLEDQYRIFRYGNDVVEPPLLGLAEPIAERGATAIPFLQKQLNAEPDDTTVRDLC